MNYKSFKNEIEKLAMTQKYVYTKAKPLIDAVMNIRNTKDVSKLINEYVPIARSYKKHTGELIDSLIDDHNLFSTLDENSVSSDLVGRVKTLLRQNPKLFDRI